jgi:hypothetical protein
VVKYFKLVIALAVLAFLGVLLWRHYFPNNEKLIRKMISSLEQDIGRPQTGKTLAELNAANSMASYFTPTAEIEAEIPELGRYTLNGRQEIVQVLVAVRADPRVSGVKVEFKDMVARVDAGKQTATVELTAKVTQTGQRDYGMQDVRLSLSKYNGDWRSAKATTVRAFK